MRVVSTTGEINFRLEYFAMNNDPFLVRSWCITNENGFIVI